MVRNKREDLDKIVEDHKIEKLLARIIVNRGISEHEDIRTYLNPHRENLHSPSKMKDMDKAAEMIIDAVDRGERIRIIGDYDQDGISSTTVLLKGLGALSGKVDYRIPDRMTDGYGINVRIVEEAKSDGVDLIVTCDNGIAAFEAVDRAKELGLKIIVTDHHDIPQRLEAGELVADVPSADAVVNPKQSDCHYEFDSLCGAAIAFKLVERIYEKLGMDKGRLDGLYQFVAMATVCDVVDLVDENRIFVREGLERINGTQNIGLKSLIRRCGIEGKKIGTYHLGFVLGPCINASGRLETANIAVELFNTEDEMEAEARANVLFELNEERKQLTEKGLQETLRLIAENGWENDSVIVAYNPSIHESIAGIVAGRIKDRFYRPAIVLTDSKREGIAKGSARSIEPYDMFEELSKVKELFEAFGGHPMAAGLSLSSENIDELRERLNENAALSEEELVEKLFIDAQVPIERISMALPEKLEMLEPFGKGNSKPLFGDKNIRIKKAAILGSGYKVLKFDLAKESGEILQGIYFGDIREMQEYIVGKYNACEWEKALKGESNEITVDLAFYPSINEYRGNRTLQIVISDYR